MTFADEEVKKSELCLWRDMVYSTVQAKVLLSESVYLQQTLGSVQKDKDFVVIPKEIRQHIIAEEADVPFVKLNPERRIYPERSDCLFLGTPLNLDFNDKTVGTRRGLVLSNLVG